MKHEKRQFDIDITIEGNPDQDPPCAERQGRPAAPAQAPGAADAGRGRDEQAARHPAQGAGAVSLLVLPLCMSLAVTSLVLQAAALQRSLGVADDALPGALLDYLHPGAGACLVLSYGISIGILAAAFVSREKDN